MLSSSTVMGRCKTFTFTCLGNNFLLSIILHKLVPKNQLKTLNFKKVCSSMWGLGAHAWWWGWRLLDCSQSLQGEYDKNDNKITSVSGLFWPCGQLEKRSRRYKQSTRAHIFTLRHRRQVTVLWVKHVLNVILDLNLLPSVISRFPLMIRCCTSFFQSTHL